MNEKSRRGLLLTANVVALAAIVFVSGGAIGPPTSTEPERLFIEPHAEGRSAEYDLRSGDVLSVVPESSMSNFALDLYIYDAQKNLVGKDSEETNSPSFSWKAPTSGRFYALAHNVSSARGYWTVTIARAKGNTRPEPLGNMAVVTVFYVTDRNKSDDNGRLGISFGSELSQDGQLHFGSCQVSIPRGHKMGELEGPAILRLEFSEDPENHIMLKTVDSETEEVFYKAVANSVAKSKRREAFVFIHGFNTTFYDAARRTAQLSYDLGFDGAPILYSWPSQGVVGVLAYNKDARNSELSAVHLKTFLDELVRASGVTTVHLIAHSMGNRPLSAAMQQIGQERTGNARPAFKQVALMAPDIDAELFRRLARQIESTAERITLYASSKDDALVLSNKYAGYPRAGQGGPNILVIPGIQSIDASEVDTSVLGLSHQYYADNRTVLSDLFRLIRGDPAEDRFGLTRIDGKGGSYFVFRPSYR